MTGLPRIKDDGAGLEESPTPATIDDEAENEERREQNGVGRC